MLNSTIDVHILQIKIQLLPSIYRSTNHRTLLMGFEVLLCPHEQLHNRPLKSIQDVSKFWS